MGQGPLNVPSFTHDNPGGVIDIPASAFVTIDASGPDVLLTAQLTGVPCLESCLLACVYIPLHKHVMLCGHTACRVVHCPLALLINEMCTVAVKQTTSMPAMLFTNCDHALCKLATFGITSLMSKC